MTRSGTERAKAVGNASPAWLPLLYHELRPGGSAYSYVLPCERFREHLLLFTRLRDELPDSYQPLITFDDGHVSNHAHALPMLQEAGIAAHFFITAGWTGTRAGYMEPRHLQDLYKAGHTIGAHSWSHAMLTGCSDAELRRELVDARLALEDWISAPVATLSLPGGRGNGRVLRACREAGYTTVWTSVPAVTRSVTDPIVGRFNILASMPDAALVALLDRKSGALERAARISSVKSAAQRLLGDRMYARLWAVLNRQEAEPPQEAEAAMRAQTAAASAGKAE